MRSALIQMTSSDDPRDNLRTVSTMIRQARSDGADFILTPEATNCISLSRAHQADVLRPESQDPTLAGLRDLAAELGVTLSIGSLALKPDGAEGRFANRSFMIGPDGGIIARYDKIHMFDVRLSETEAYEESRGYRPGEEAVIADCAFAKIGMTICYDLRFPHLFRDLAKAGAHIMTVPAAFAPATGQAHWEVLLRARAIECGAFVLAAAQTGTHPSQTGAPRKTYGHSIAIAPWGEVLAMGGTSPGIIAVDLDLTQVAQARQRVPALTHDRSYSGPRT